jgi:hypothetical protein
MALGEIILAHHAREVGERLLMGFGLLETPVHVEADHDAPEHARDQHPVAAADTAPSLPRPRGAAACRLVCPGTIAAIRPLP